MSSAEPEMAPDIPDLTVGGTVINAQGSALLASLIGFIGPIVATAYPTSSDSHYGLNSFGPATARIYDSTEAKELVKTLGNFIGVVIEAHSDSVRVHKAVSSLTEASKDFINTNLMENAVAPFINLHVASHKWDTTSDTSVEAPNLYMEDGNTGYMDSHSEDIETGHITSSMGNEPNFPFDGIDNGDDYWKTARVLSHLAILKNKVQEHVFNKMPIRLLAFDSSGNNIELLERKAVAACIMSCIQEAYPDGVPKKDMERIIHRYSGYAILSHTWIRNIPGDVVYNDWKGRKLLANSEGNFKIDNFCKVAACDHNVMFGWMDTVCINKDSSSELDESIRSMYKWYQGAYVCVIYLAETLEIKDIHQDSWFTRGWTLQELLAPRNSKFYNQIWCPFFPHKSSSSPAFDEPESKEFYLMAKMPLELQNQIFKATTITGPELQVLNNSPVHAPLSRILQLAACRKVTREEDSIYSLMGLLGVGFPIAYGEGSASALKRLIQEIMISRAQFMDLFNHRNEHRIIPTNIQDYANSSNIFHSTAFSSRLNFFAQPKPVMLTHLGVRLTVLAVPAFRKDIYKDLIPLKSKSHIFTVPPTPHWPWFCEDPQDYILLDNSKYSANWMANFVAVAIPHNGGSVRVKCGHPTVIFMAIITSSIDHDNGTYLLLPDNALCIAMLNNNINFKKLADIKPDMQISGPMTIPLPYSTNPGQQTTIRISREEADKLGFKTITQYFT